MPPESFVTVAELGDRSCWFATPVQFTVYVDELAPSTDTDSDVLNVTSMFKYDDVFTAPAVVVNPVKAASASSAIPNLAVHFVFTLIVSPCG